MTWNRNNVSVLSSMSTREMLFQGASIIKIQLSMLVYSNGYIIISANITCPRYDIPVFENVKIRDL
jgi:hypothetical protein